MHLQYLQPVAGSSVCRTSFGTWQRQALFVRENAFMHLLQQQFLAWNPSLITVSWVGRSDGLY